MVTIKTCQTRKLEAEHKEANTLGHHYWWELHALQLKQIPWSLGRNGDRTSLSLAVRLDDIVKT